MAYFPIIPIHVGDKNSCVDYLSVVKDVCQVGWVLHIQIRLSGS